MPIFGAAGGGIRTPTPPQSPPLPAIDITNNGPIRLDINSGTGLPVTPVQASGGVGTLTYAISPSVPTGLSYNTANGALTGTPTTGLANTSFTVTVSDQALQQSINYFEMSVTVPPLVTTIEGGTGGIWQFTTGNAIPAFTPVSASGGVGTITYSISNVATLNAASIAFNTGNGSISGTPTSTIAQATYTVTATDSLSPTPQTSSKDITLTIISASQFYTIVANSPNVQVGYLTPTGQYSATPTPSTQYKYFKYNASGNMVVTGNSSPAMKTVTVIGVGGGGGTLAAVPDGSSGGGGGGGVRSQTYTIAAPLTATVTVGAGGANTPGAAAGSSSFMGGVPGTPAGLPSQPYNVGAGAGGAYGGSQNVIAQQGAQARGGTGGGGVGGRSSQVPLWGVGGQAQPGNGAIGSGGYGMQNTGIGNTAALSGTGPTNYLASGGIGGGGGGAGGDGGNGVMINNQLTVTAPSGYTLAKLQALAYTGGNGGAGVYANYSLPQGTYSFGYFGGGGGGGTYMSLPITTFPNGVYYTDALNLPAFNGGTAVAGGGAGGQRIVTSPSFNPAKVSTVGQSGQVNTGGGGGGTGGAFNDAGTPLTSGSGGSGTVIIIFQYKD